MILLELCLNSCLLSISINFQYYLSITDELHTVLANHILNAHQELIIEVPPQFIYSYMLHTHPKMIIFTCFHNFGKFGNTFLVACFPKFCIGWKSIVLGNGRPGKRNNLLYGAYLYVKITKLDFQI